MKATRNNTQSLKEKAKRIFQSMSQDEISSIVAALQSTCEKERRDILSKLSNCALVRFIAAQKLWHGTC